MRQIIQTENAPSAIGPYSQGVRAGDLVFVSGQVPLNAAGDALVGDTPGEQTAQCLRNVAAVAEAAGTSLDNAVRLTIFTTDLGAFAEINEAYGGFFGDEPPARAAIGVAALPKDAMVEIDAVLLAG